MEYPLNGKEEMGNLPTRFGQPLRFWICPDLWFLGAQEKYLEALGVRTHAKHPPSYWWLDIPPTLSKELGMSKTRHPTQPDVPER